MKIIALNGSHRPGKNTAGLLQTVLGACEKLGAQTELVELSQWNIRPCTSCHACLRQSVCSISDDDMAALGDKLLTADGILLGSPVYWSNVSTYMKNFMDRSRYLHMTANLLQGKIGGAVTGAGLLVGGQELALMMMETFLKQQGLLLADCRDNQGMVTATGVAGSLTSGMADGKTQYRRRFTDDPLLVQSAEQLGMNMVHLIQMCRSE